jgi:hypothetical protein
MSYLHSYDIGKGAGEALEDADLNSLFTTKITWVMLCGAHQLGVCRLLDSCLVLSRLHGGLHALLPAATCAFQERGMNETTATMPTKL